MSETDQQSVPASHRGVFNQKLLRYRIVLPAVGVLGTIALMPWIKDLLAVASPSYKMMGLSLLFLPLVFTIWIAVLFQPELHFFCDECDRHISSKEHWVCGYCGELHESNWGFCFRSFFESCLRCGKPPRAYRCHHCGDNFFLNGDREPGHPATHAADAREKPINAQWDRKLRQLNSLVDSTSDLQTRKVSSGSHLTAVFSLDESSGRVKVAWMLKPNIQGDLRVIGYSGNKVLFSDVGREGMFTEIWEPREYLCRLEAHPAGEAAVTSKGKLDEVVYLLHIPEPTMKPEPVESIEDKRQKLLALYRERMTTDTTIAEVLQEYEMFLDKHGLPKPEKDRLIGRLRIDLQRAC